MKTTYPGGAQAVAHDECRLHGEGNRDGSDDNRSWNCRVEGPTDDPAVVALRARQRRNLLATLLLSEGMPLLLECVARLCRLRREQPVLRRNRFFGPGHVQWLRPDGSPMDGSDWSNPDARAVTVAVADGALLVNAWWEPLTFRLPREGRWTVEFDTADPGSRRVVADTVELAGRSLALVSASS